MNSLAAILTSVAVLLPGALGQLGGDAAPAEEVVAQASPEDRQAPSGISSLPLNPLRVLEESRRPPMGNQVRIEQRIIIRIAPSSPQLAERSMADLARRADSFEEVRLKDCVPINMIAAVTPNQNRLLLFMRDNRVLSAALERACNPEDFYSGFYIERQDGQLCERRDRLQSRAGASCRVSRLSRLVASRD